MSIIKEITKSELEEHEYAMDLAARLDKVIKFLGQHGADDELIETLCEVIEDNQQWINEELLACGSVQ